MAKYIADGKITVETRMERYEFYASDLAISSSDFGLTHDLLAQGLRNMSTTTFPTPRETLVTSEDSKTDEPALTHEQKTGLESILVRAKQIEWQQFHNAHAIQAAEREARKLTADAEHKFNMAVLETLHTGLSQEAIEKHLFDSGFSQLEEKVDTIHTLDTELLYEVAE